MCKKDKTQVQQTYEVFSYIPYATTLFDRTCLYMNISYINICTLNKNRKCRKERMRQVGGDGVCGCSIGEPLRQQDTFKTSLYIQRRA